MEVVLDFADYACTVLRRALEGSQTFLTAIILMVASERRMAADRFTARLDGEIDLTVQILNSNRAVRVGPAVGIYPIHTIAGFLHNLFQ